jgi:hypothetical protein
MKTPSISPTREDKNSVIQSRMAQRSLISGGKFFDGEGKTFEDNTMNQDVSQVVQNTNSETVGDMHILKLNDNNSKLSTNKEE